MKIIDEIMDLRPMIICTNCYLDFAFLGFYLPQIPLSTIFSPKKYKKRRQSVLFSIFTIGTFFTSITKEPRYGKTKDSVKEDHIMVKQCTTNKRNKGCLS